MKWRFAKLYHPLGRISRVLSVEWNDNTQMIFEYHQIYLRYLPSCTIDWDDNVGVGLSSPRLHPGTMHMKISRGGGQRKPPSVPLWIFMTPWYTCTWLWTWGEIRAPFRQTVVHPASCGHNHPPCIVSWGMGSVGVCRSRKDRRLLSMFPLLPPGGSCYLHGVGNGN